VNPSSVVVVGGGLAGLRCAETLRAESYEGELVVVGEEAVAAYERPALSKEFLAGERRFDELLLRPQEFWTERGIDLRLRQRVVAVDGPRRTVATDRGEELHWDALVIATGARARRLPIAAPPGVHVLRTLTDAAELRRDLIPGRRLVIVGGGFVGVEVASTARALAVAVTLLEAGAAPFARALGRELGHVLSRRYQEWGVDVRIHTCATAFRAGGDGRVRAVVLSDGSELRCDVVLVAIGIDPARELLPRQPGLPVYGCGDAAGGSGHWASAAAGGAGVARKILGLDPLPTQPPFFWSDQFGLRIQLVGEPGGAARVELDGGKDAFVARYRAADGRLVAALAANRPAEVGPLRRELALAA
jgi:3-phenylpropionate/trans-cinnamate dioxygenase ferredoxin reductase subunit